MSGMPSGLAYEADSGYDARFDGTASGKGYLTGTRSFCLGGASGTVVSAFYYDAEGRMVQQRSTNLLGGFDTDCFTYSFSGKPLKHKHVHTATGKSTQTEVYTYTYDSAERLKEVYHKLNNQAEVLLANNTYDELGRLSGKQLHGDMYGTTYAYNVRGWLTGISGSKFSQYLYYNTGNGTARYNGNISSMTWNGGDGVTRGYKYAYDGLGRLTDAAYGEGASIGSNAGRFTEKVTGYDKNGNILSLQRYGQTSVSGYGLMDNLSFTLDGNRLNRVDDAVGTAAYAGGFEFKDGVKQADEYAYDANGNLTKDLNKGITDIQYNFLNLPNKVTFSDGSTITYTYTADGTKLRTVCMIGGVTTTTDYPGNVIYENGVTKLLLTEAGYVTLNDNKYHYYLQDHQGNNRVVVNESGSVEEVNHYYPFGGTFASVSSSVQPFKYNGKELDTKKGLDWYDYGTRRYDVELGRFTTVDPLTEKYYSESPYSYCGNNPIMFIDPDGQMKVIYNPDGTYKETTHNNWFHNTFIGRQEYIAYKEGNVRLSEQEFWNWQRTGSYSSVQEAGNMTNIEFALDEPAKGVVDGISKFILSSVYSLVNSPKVVLTGRTWSGASQTPTERMDAVIDVVSTYMPLSKAEKVGKPGSWYKFKKANKHIPVSKRKGVYNAEVRKYKGKSRKIDAFEKIQEPLNLIHYSKEQEE